MQVAWGSYPSLLVPAFVACSYAGEGRYNWVTWHDVLGRMEEWHITGKTASKWVRYRLQTRTVELSARHQTVVATFLVFRKPLYSCREGMCHSSIRPGTSNHVTQFYQAFLRVQSTVATNAGTRRPGYEAEP